MNKRVSAGQLFCAILPVALLQACELPPVKTIQVTEGSVANPNPAASRNSENPRPPGESSDKDTPHWIEINRTADTVFKLDSINSSELSQEQKCLFARGTRHSLAAAPEWLGSHVKIQLKKPMAACGFTTGYVFAAHIGQSSDSPWGPVLQTHNSTATLYTTENTAMEGGPKDRCGRALRTLDDYLKGNAEYVSVAMDSIALPYGTLIRIPEIEQRFGVKTAIPFKIVDTGSAFVGRGTSRMDICVGHNQQTIFSDKYIWISHKSFEIQVITKGASFSCQ